MMRPSLQRPWLLVLLGASVPSGTRGMCTCQGDPACWCWSNCTATLDAACGGGRPRDAARPGVDPADACRACAGSSQPTLAEAGCTAAAVEAFCAKKKRPAFQAFWNSRKCSRSLCVFLEKPQKRLHSAAGVLHLADGAGAGV